MTNKAKFLVTGATGNIGGAVVSALLAKGMSVRAGSTRPETAQYDDRVEKVKLVYGETETVKAALEGISGVYLIAPPMDPFAQRVLIPFIDAAKEAGVNHIILNSSFGVEFEEDDALRITEKYLMACGVNYSIFRPNFIMENFTSGFIAPMIAEGGIFLAADEVKTSFVACKDIGACAAVAFDEMLYDGEFNLSGPEAISHSDVARVISQKTGRSIQYHALSEEEMLAAARAQGMPEASVEMFGGLYHLTREGIMARVFNDVNTITGTPPQSFAQFAASVNW